MKSSNFYVITTLLTSLLFFSSCSNAPAGDEEVVQDLVLDTSLKLLKDQGCEYIVSYCVQGNDIKKEAFKVKMALGFSVFAAAFNRYEKTLKGEEDDFSKYKMMTDSARREGLISLQSIRIIDKDEKAKKTNCEAVLKIGEYGEFPLEYFAQYTTDDDIYVEVRLDALSELDKWAN